MFAYPPVWIPSPVRWVNYLEAMDRAPLLVWLANTAMITILAMTGTLLSSSLVAFGFARLRFPGRRLLFYLLLSTMMLPDVVTLVPQFVLFRSLGWVDTFAPLVVPAFLGGGAFNVFLVRQVSTDDPTRLRRGGPARRRLQPADLVAHHAAAVPAGADRGGHLLVRLSWNDFLLPLIYLQSEGNKTLALGLRAFISPTDASWNISMAASMFLVIPVLIVFFRRPAAVHPWRGDDRHLGQVRGSAHGPGEPSGVRVLEVGVFMAAPYASMQLADLGARVIKVEDPRSGDPVRASGPFLAGESSPYLRLNRNKESVALDLKSAAGKQAFLALVETADVVVENLRPGAMARLGIDAAGIWAVNPRRRLRLRLRLGPGRAAGAAPRAGHHGPGPQRDHEHHGYPGRCAGEGRRPGLRPGLRAVPGARGHRGAARARPHRRAASRSTCRCSRPA